MTSIPIDENGIIFPLDGHMPLLSGDVSVDGTPTGHTGNVRYVINHEAHILLETKIDMLLWHTLQSKNEQRFVKVNNSEFPKCSVINLGLSATAGNPVVNSVTFISNYSKKPAIDVSSIEFSIVNAPKWIGSAVTYGSTQRFCRISLSLGSYTIEIDSIGKDDEPIRKDKGYSFTALGRIFKTDGSSFKSDCAEAELAYESVMWGLNFSTGHWPFSPAVRYVPPQGAPVFRYSVKRHMPYDWGQTWHSPTHPTALIEAIQGIFIKLSDTTWERPIREAINWYADAISQNGTSVGALIWAQTGLELMAWTYLTQDSSTTTMSEEDFDRKVTPGASQKISALLDAINVNRTIPTRYSSLHKFSTDLAAASTAGQIKLPPNDPLDGPSVITHVRNTFVHPKKGNKRPLLPDDSHFESKYLALEYLEFAILKVIGVNAPVVHRSAGTGLRSVNAVSPLPWQAPTAP